MIKRILYILVIITNANSLLSQFNNNWLIGGYGGIRFNQDTISIIYNPHDLYYNTTIYSDCSGQLSVYNHDNYIYNRNHGKVANVMLGTNNSGVDENIIIPIPRKKNEYYTIFNRNPSIPTLLCHKINMNLNNGLGGFTTTNPIGVYYFKNASKERVALTKHANGIDYWLIVQPHYHITYPYSSDTLYAFLVDSSGISQNPIKSKLNSILTNDTFGNSFTPIVMSNNGKQIAVSNNVYRTANPNNITLYTYDFDNSTGIFSNEQKKLSQNNHLYSIIYDIEYSPNDSFIYVQTLEVPYSPYPPRIISPEILLQIKNYSTTVLTNSKLIYRDKDKTNVGLRLAPNNQIIVSYHTNKYLSTIEFPNKPFPLCNFKKDKIKYTNYQLSSGILPFKIPDLKLINFDSKETEQGYCTDTTELSMELDSSFIQVSIYFGDGDSLLLNNSEIKTTKKIKHYYKNDGTYLCKLKALVNTCGYTLWNSHNLYVKKKPLKSNNIPNVFSYCDSALLTLNDSFQYADKLNIYWGDKDTLKLSSNQGKTQLNVSHTYDLSNNYTIKYELSNINGCVEHITDTINVQLLPKPILNYKINGHAQQINKSYYGCEPFKLNFIDSTTDLKMGTIQWNNQNENYAYNQSLSQTFDKGTYQIVINDTNTFGCVSTDTFYVEAWSKPNLNIQLKTISNCIKDNQFKFINNTNNNINDSVDYYMYWSINDSIKLIDSLSLTFKDTGLKQIRYIASSKNGCQTIIDTSLNVYPYASAKFVVNKDTQCLNGNEFNLKLSKKEDVLCNWNMGNDSIIDANGLYDVNFSYKSKGNYQIRNITNTRNQCKDTFVNYIVVLESPKAEFIVLDTSMCLNGNEFKVNVSTSPAIGTNQLLNWGDTSSINGFSNGELKHSYKSSGVKFIKLVSELNSCKDSITKNIYLHPHPSIQIQEKGYCIGETSKFNYLNLNQLKLKSKLWKINSVFISDKDSFDYKFKSQGKYKMELFAKSEFDCNGLFEKEIEIFETPTALFDYTQIGRNNNGIEIYYYNKSKNENSWLWLLENGDTFKRKNIYYTYNDTGFSYTTLIAGNREVCYDTITLKIPILDKINFYFPTAFSPNQNNTNDGFGLNSNQFELVKEYEITIFNRWGGIVYRTNQVQRTWNPSSAPIGIYIFTAKIRDVYNVLHEINGIVEVIE